MIRYNTPKKLKLLSAGLCLFSTLMFCSGQVWAQADALYIAPSGNIGIGTNDPQNKLQLSGNLHMNGNAVYLKQNPLDVNNFMKWNSTTDRIDIAGGKGISLGYTSGSFNPTFTLTENGNIGIGTDAPSSKLEVNGDIKLPLGKKIWWDADKAIEMNKTSNYNAMRFKNPSFYNLSTGYFDGGFDFADATGSLVRIINTAGAGAANPKVELNVMGNILTHTNSTNNQGSTQIGMLSGGFTGMELQTESYSGGNGGIIKFYTWGGAVYSREVVRINEKGYVGVGTTNPTAPLEVGISGSAVYCPSIRDQYTILAYAYEPDKSNHVYLALSGGGQPATQTAAIYTPGNMLANGYLAFSDSRIKTQIKNADSKNDLAVINNINVVSYKYKDNIAHDDKLKKGFIAQQVEKIFPQAVTQRADFTPDIFAMAEQVNVKDGLLTITMKAPHNLKNGDIVRVMQRDKDVKEVAVKVVDDKTFTVAAWQNEVSGLFVYGKKVNDFRTVDYQQVFSLGISAIQELSKEMEALKLENEALRKRDNTNQELMAGIQNRLQLLENKVEAGNKTAVK